MNEKSFDERVLEEIQKIRRNLQAAWLVFVSGLFTILIFYFWYRGHTYPSFTTRESGQTASWSTLRAAIERCEYDRAANIARSIVTQYPSDYHGYVYLGDIASATGHIEEAERYYVHAADLLPNQQNEEMVNAVRKRLDRTRSETPSSN